MTFNRDHRRVQRPLCRIFKAPHLSLTFALLTSGCGGGDLTINVQGRDKTIIVPSSASVQPPYSSEGDPPPRRYVVRMSDGSLDWEVELPEVATGYELRIPFKGKNRGEANRGGVQFGDTEGLTEADREIIAAMRRRVNFGKKRLKTRIMTPRVSTAHWP